MLYILIPIAITFSGWVITKFLEAPKLNIHIAINSTSSFHNRYINLVPWEDDPHVFNPRKSVVRFVLKYYLSISINNIGKNPATEISYSFHNDSPIIDINNFIRKDQLLLPGSEYQYDGMYKIYQHSSPEDRKRNDVIINRVLLKNLKIMFKYRGALGLYKYSIYD